MEFLIILVAISLVAVIIAVNPTWMMKALFGILTFFIGLIVQIEGISYGSTALIVPNTQMSFMLMILMTLGSLVTIYSVTIKKDVSMS
jgi:hypothetical protein